MVETGLYLATSKDTTECFLINAIARIDQTAALWASARGGGSFTSCFIAEGRETCARTKELLLAIASVRSGSSCPESLAPKMDEMVAGMDPDNRLYTVFTDVFHPKPDKPSTAMNPSSQVTAIAP
jgi:hypothetical protein